MHFWLIETWISYVSVLNILKRMQILNNNIKLSLAYIPNGNNQLNIDKDSSKESSDKLAKSICFAFEEPCSLLYLLTILSNLAFHLISYTPSLSTQHFSDGTQYCLEFYLQNRETDSA